MPHAGDKHRFVVFADFIIQMFPDAKLIADIAGGHGNLSFHLHEAGKQPTIVDVRDTTFPRWIHRTLRKKARRTGKVTTIPRLVKDVREVDLSIFDLIVALHPDQATEHAVRTAVQYDIDFAVVPCCVFPIDSVKRSKEDWVPYLASLAPGSEMEELAISGANVVVYWKGKGGTIERSPRP